MTRSIVENILTVEKKAESIVASAKADVVNLQTTLEQELTSLREAYKEESRKRSIKDQQEIEEKVSKIKEKIERRSKDELEALKQSVKDNHSKAKKYIMQHIVRDQ